MIFFVCILYSKDNIYPWVQRLSVERGKIFLRGELQSVQTLFTRRCALELVCDASVVVCHSFAESLPAVSIPLAEGDLHPSRRAPPRRV